MPGSLAGLSPSPSLDGLPSGPSQTMGAPGILSRLSLIKHSKFSPSDASFTSCPCCPPFKAMRSPQNCLPQQSDPGGFPGPGRLSCSWGTSCKGTRGHGSALPPCPALRLLGPEPSPQELYHQSRWGRLWREETASSRERHMLKMRGLAAGRPQCHGHSLKKDSLSACCLLARRRGRSDTLPSRSGHWRGRRTTRKWTVNNQDRFRCDK